MIFSSFLVLCFIPLVPQAGIGQTSSSSFSSSSGCSGECSYIDTDGYNPGSDGCLYVFCNNMCGGSSHLKPEQCDNPGGWTSCI